MRFLDSILKLMRHHPTVTPDNVLPISRWKLAGKLAWTLIEFENFPYPEAIFRISSETLIMKRA
ncbi:hypothetical protein FBPa45_0006 [Pseudomonas phage vB_PaeS_FBPa45]|nr:hypothetical protein FBPa45_0006 [Pseudomonas phage vB_PaeS_FBPa45]